MNRVTLIQLRGNIPYTLSGIGGIDSKHNLHDYFLLYQISESFLLSNEVP